MARAIHKLTARAAETISKPGRHSDGGGLYLSISAEGRRRWVFLYHVARQASRGGPRLGEQGRRVTEGGARKGRRGPRAGQGWRRSDRRMEQGGPRTEVPTFGKTADDFLAAHEGGWRNDKHKAQWAMTLTRYCEPIRNMPVDAIDTEAVLSVLKPLWTRAPETASRLRGRIEQFWTRPRRAASSAATKPTRRAGAAISTSSCRSAPS